MNKNICPKFPVLTFFPDPIFAVPVGIWGKVASFSQYSVAVSKTGFYVKLKKIRCIQAV